MSHSSIYFLIFMTGLFSSMIFKFHYFMTLLSIELMMMSLYCSFSTEMIWGSSLDLLLVFVITMVIEGAFGLCILVKYMNSWGGGYFSQFNNF